MKLNREGEEVDRFDATTIGIVSEATEDDLYRPDVWNGVMRNSDEFLPGAQLSQLRE